MPFLERVGGPGTAVKAAYAIAQPGKATEFLAEAHADVVAFRTLLAARPRRGVILQGADTSTEGLGNITLSGEQTLNGLLTAASRVLVGEQTDGKANGSYRTAAGAWARCPDAEVGVTLEPGTMILIINAGSTKYKTLCALMNASKVLVGTDNQTWAAV